jgi:hypothetical protein
MLLGFLILGNSISDNRIAISYGLKQYIEAQAPPSGGSFINNKKNTSHHWEFPTFANGIF